MGLGTDTRFTLTYSRDDLSASATVDNLGGAPATRTCGSGACDGCNGDPNPGVFVNVGFIGG